MTGEGAWYRDADADTYGNPAVTTSACSLPSGYVTNDDDCDDTSAAVSPADAEVCGDGLDQDCDGADDTCEVGDYAGDYGVDDGYETKIYGGAAGDAVGIMIADGDFDGDGTSDLVVGASGAAVGSYDGALYGYYGPLTTGAWAAASHDDFAYSNPSSSAAGDFGGAVYNVGDVNGDGADDMVVWAGSYSWVMFYGGDTGTASYTSVDDNTFTCQTAAPGGDFDGSAGNEWFCGNLSVSSNRGAVYVHSGTATSAATSLGGEAVGDYFGWSVAGGGDLDGDGIDDLVATAPFDDDGGASTGSAYIVYGPVTGTVGIGTAYDHKLTGEATTDYLGALSLVTGDVDGDGRDDFLVASANHEGSAGASSGAVYLVTDPGSGVITSHAAAIFEGEDAADSVTETALDLGDIDGDGVLDLLVGSMNNGDGGSAAGAVWLVYGPLGGSMTLADADACWLGAYAADNLGTDVAVLADQDGDGDDEIAISGYVHDYGSTSTAASNRGAVWIWPGD